MSAKPRSARKPEITVFIVRQETKCAECRQQLGSGSWIMLVCEGDSREARCLECADLDHLVFLPTGNAALTRRAGKHSPLRAVVVQWSRSRQRYERQGTMVEEPALELAEKECLADAEQRAARAERRRDREAKMDEVFIGTFAEAIRELYPAAPEKAATAVARRACQRNSGRVGRSAGARDLDPGAVRLAVRAHLRHAATNYDKLLMKGFDRDLARAEISEQLDDAERAWIG